MKKGVIVVENGNFKLAFLGTDEESKEFIRDYKKSGNGRFFERTNEDNLETWDCAGAPADFKVSLSTAKNVRETYLKIK